VHIRERREAVRMAQNACGTVSGTASYSDGFGDSGGVSSVSIERVLQVCRYRVFAKGIEQSYEVSTREEAAGGGPFAQYTGRFQQSNL
jgi:hypothetical protein